MINLTEGSTWRGIVRVVTGVTAAFVLFKTGDAETAQQTAGQIGEQLQSGATSLNAAGAMIVAIVGEGVKGLIGMFKKEAGES